VHLRDWPAVDEGLVNEGLERSMEVIQSLVESSLAARQKAGEKLRHPVGKIMVETDSEDVREAMAMLEDVFLELTNAKSVQVVRKLPSVLEMRPNMAGLGKKFRSEAGRVAEALSGSDPVEVKSGLEGDGEYRLGLGKKTVEISPGDVVFSEALPGSMVGLEGPMAKVAVDLAKTDELLSEALTKELVRRIQDMRKDMDLQIDDFIEVAIQGPGELKRVESSVDYIATETRSRAVKLDGDMPGDANTKEWKVEGEKYVISIRKVH
jgi:isoleucyl-tRNA synthetase